MRIVVEDGLLKLHISSSITDNYVVSNGKKYNYKRLVIPNVLMDYFHGLKDDLSYVYLYFLEDHVLLSVEKLDGLKYSKRKIVEMKNKKTVYINLNERSFHKHNLSIGSNVLFVISGDSLLENSDCIGIELFFVD